LALAPTLSAVVVQLSRPSEIGMTSRYLDRPLIPLAAALPRMLEKIEAELAAAQPTEKSRLRQRTELLRGLLAPSQPISDDADTDPPAIGRGWTRPWRVERD
jgi:hypothetical protein